MVNNECDAAILVETAARWDGAPQWYQQFYYRNDTVNNKVQQTIVQ